MMVCRDHREVLQGYKGMNRTLCRQSLCADNAGQFFPELFSNKAGEPVNSSLFILGYPFQVPTRLKVSLLLLCQLEQHSHVQ